MTNIATMVKNNNKKQQQNFNPMQVQNHSYQSQHDGNDPSNFMLQKLKVRFWACSPVGSGL